MLELKECCKVPFPEKLTEAYEIGKDAIFANVNASRALKMMARFIELHEEPLFLILEIPAQKEENDKANDILNDIYYLDGCNREEALDILDAVGDFLVKDGLNTFGFAGHNSHEEILFGKYNVMTIYTRKPKAYRAFFAEFSIPQTDELITAWETFDPEHPGESTRYEKDGKTIYDIPEAYREYGMYLAEKRSENDEKITLPDLIGKILLAGLSYYTAEDELIERKQLWGTVTEANEKMICVMQKNGEIFTLPSDLRSTRRAKAGNYTLHSTGEIVENPDFLVTWNITASETENEESDE